MSNTRYLAVALLLAVAAAPLYAITYIVPGDSDLVARAEGIVIARGIESHSEMTAASRVVTLASLRIEQVLKGDLKADSTLELEEMGGFAGGRMTLIPGSPRYEDGKRYLIFLRTTSEGEWATYGMGLGKFEYARDLYGRELLVRGEGNEIFGWSAKTSELHVERYRAANEFLEFIRTLVRDIGAPARSDYFVDPADSVLSSFSHSRLPRLEVNASRPEFLSTGNFRWQNGGQANIVHCCLPTLQPNLNGPGAVGSANGNWNNVGTSVNYMTGPHDASATGGLLTTDGKNAVLFNDPSGQFPPGPAGVGGISSAVGQYQLSDGFSYFNTQEIDVVINDGLNTDQATFVGVMTHELGHTLGFRHSDQNQDNIPGSGCGTLPCAGVGQAIMASTVSFGLSNLQSFDREAIQTVYGSGPVCTPPSVQNISANPFSINAGQSSILSVTATGTAPQTFQWFVGNPGNFSQPIAGATNISVQVSPTTTTTYFVQITGCSQSINSQGVQVVVQTVCPTVSVTAMSASAAGGGFTLTANATGGSGFNYQWFVGSSSGPSAGSGQTISVNPSVTTTYVVRATNSCNNVGEGSVTVTVVGGCPAVTANMPIVNATAGGSFVLSAGASGGTGFEFAWFTGTPPSGNFVAGGQIINVAPTVPTSFFFRATNSCGSFATSVAITVTPTQNCVTPQIAGVTADPTSITSGQSARLTVNASGTALAFQWYIGPPGNFSQPIAGANSASVMVSPTSTTTYFVQVASGCGAPSVNSPAVTVTVSTGNQCVPAAITAQPASTSVSLSLTTMLSVAASGTAPLTYQWFVGQPGDTSQPIAGATGTSVVVRPTGTTTFWVRVTGQCGNPVNSSGATVTTVPARRRSSRR